MASVAFEFSLPGQPDITKLYILESAVEEGPFTVVEIVTDLGSYPDYINNYTTDLATDENYWFAIKWEDAKGATSNVSAPFKGNTQSVVSQIVQRVIQRGVSVDESVIIQEAEAVSERFFKMNPYDVVLPVSYNVLSGLTYLVLAHLIVHDIVSGSSESYTAGLVSQKSASGSSDRMKFLADLIKMAQEALGMPTSVVLELADIDPTGLGTFSSISFDQSRLALTVNFE